ncbi:MAG TPA: hypothetical protein VGI12_10790 [Vicinamibacterales bacterium]|jgi:hypothetical protein
MPVRRLSVLIVAMLALAGTVFGADISGKWTASFDTQIGQQNYTYEFTTKGDVVTGTAKSENGESVLRNVKVDGNKLTFVEMLKFQDMDIEITYTGTIVSADEIKFTRQVGEFATEELVAKRAK